MISLQQVVPSIQNTSIPAGPAPGHGSLYSPRGLSLSVYPLGLFHG